MRWVWPGVALASLCLVTPAHAALSLCNRTSYILYAATAAATPAQTETEGWTRIVPGECRQARGEELTAQSYLVHARSSLGHSGPARAWGGTVSLCVKDANFRLRQGGPKAACTEDGAFALPFAVLNTGGKRSWAMTLDDAPALASLMAAQLAGVKRLLHDNGYDAGPIDSAPSKKTGAALAAFRKRANLPDRAGNAELFTALEQEALKSNAPAGYTICNDGKVLLEAALAETAQKSVVHGWWTVPPGACARALTAPLGKQAYYLYARQKDGKAVVTGSEKFCVAATAFEIRERGNCAARGQTEAGFTRTQTNGLAGHVARIGEKGLSPGGAPAGTSLRR